MATSNAHRVAAFLLAALFLLTSIGGTAYVIWQINQQESGIVDDSTSANQTDDQTACGQTTLDKVEPRKVPGNTKAKTPVKELKTTDIKDGNGDVIQPGDCVVALYYGSLAKNGKKFDGNYETGQPAEFSLSGVIEGWQKGIPGMKVGGIRRLEIPAAQGYGEQGSGEDIPPNSDLVFEVEILSTKRGTQQ